MNTVITMFLTSYIFLCSFFSLPLCSYLRPNLSPDATTSLYLSVGLFYIPHHTAVSCFQLKMILSVSVSASLHIVVLSPSSVSCQTMTRLHLNPAKPPRKRYLKSSSELYICPFRSKVVIYTFQQNDNSTAVNRVLLISCECY